ncbi:MAG: hypothetical protein D6795_20300 [Deltaproteobacteria bacterium]|nr:MAG: hypothetical protein D6795_20300 [Deltaproteobacteria bacterium]
MTEWWDADPSIGEVQEAVRQKLQSDPQRFERMARRLRRRNLLPELTVWVRRNFGADATFKVASDTEITADGEVFVGPDTESFVLANQQDLSLQFRVSWDLAGIYLDSEELKLPRLADAAQRHTTEALLLATKLYYERKRMLVTCFLDPPEEGVKRARLEMEIEELTARLDALTGGRFTRASKDRKRLLRCAPGGGGGG